MFFHLVLLNLHFWLRCSYSLILWFKGKRTESYTPFFSLENRLQYPHGQRNCLVHLYPPNTTSSIYQPLNTYRAYTNSCLFYDIERAFPLPHLFILSSARPSYYPPEPTLAKVTKVLLTATFSGCKGSVVLYAALLEFSLPLTSRLCCSPSLCPSRGSSLSLLIIPSSTVFPKLVVPRILIYHPVPTHYYAF